MDERRETEEEVLLRMPFFLPSLPSFYLPFWCSLCDRETQIFSSIDIVGLCFALVLLIVVVRGTAISRSNR